MFANAHGWTLAAILSMGVITSASGASPIYRCMENGQPLLTDKPCPDPKPAAISSGAPSPQPHMQTPIPPSAVAGDWTGQTQFQGAQNGQQLQDAHTVVPVRLTFSPDGKVSAFSSENGCKLLGLWSPGATPRLFSLDITLSQCHNGGFNRRYTGTMITGNLDSSAQFAIQAYTIPIPGVPLRRYDVEATLRR